MKKNQIFIFLLVLLGELTVVFFEFDRGEWFFKPLICFWLLASFAWQTKLMQVSIKKWFIGALIFSWVGDVLLLFVGDDPLFFLLGLSSFLVAHIFYILFFHLIRRKENSKPRWALAIPVVIYYGVLIWMLNPHLGDMTLPVRIYGIVISFMLMLALHMIYINKRTAGLLMMTGAGLFVVSDSILAINKFYQSFEGSEVLVMLSYGLAQLFLTSGAIEYLSSVYKE